MSIEIIPDLDNFISMTLLDEIVMDGEKGSPCFLGNPSDAPWELICVIQMCQCVWKSGLDQMQV